MTLEQALAELQNPDAQARVHAVRWLRVLGGPQAVAALIGALDDPDPNGAVPMRAEIALGEMKAREAVPILIERLRSAPHPASRQITLVTLSEIGDPRAVPAVVGALDDLDEQVVRDACRALSSLRDTEAVGPLLRLLDHPGWLVRHAACEALFDLEVNDDRLSAVLEELSQADAHNSPTPQLHRELSAALERLAQRAPAAASAEAECIAEGSADYYRTRCRWMIHELARRRAGESHEEAPGLAEAEGSSEALEAALAQLRDPDPVERWGAVYRLLGRGEPEVVTALITALEDRSPKVRSTAVLSLGRLEAPEAAPALICHLLNDASARVRLMCASQLDDFLGENVSEALRQALSDPDPGVVASATIALRIRGDRQAVPLLFPLLEHPKWRNRLHAAEALLQFEAADERLVSALEKLAREPEAEEHDLNAEEFNSNLDSVGQEYAEMGQPEPQPCLTMAEMVEQSRQLLAGQTT